MLDRTRPYNDLPPLPPSSDVETREVLKKCVNARTALVELKTSGHLLPDQTVLSSIPLLEAKDSSEIENIVTTNDALFRQASMNPKDGDPAAKEALRYRTALYEGFQHLKNRPLASRTAVDICRTITGIDLDVRATPGTALRNSHTGEIIYTPPEGQDRIRDLLANWEAFVNAGDDLDPVVRMAIQHYQFEAIHPFPDGNGRTGRVLNVLTLIQYGLLDMPTLYLSRHILHTRGEYYRLLDAVTGKAEWQPWILYMLDAVENTAKWTSSKIRAIRSLIDDASAYIRRTSPKIYSLELVHLLFGQPYCRIADFSEHGIAKRQTAAKYLHVLRDTDVLWELPSLGEREKVFVNHRYRDLIGSDNNAYAPFPA